MRLSDMYFGVADFISEHGLVKGKLQHNDSYCALGAWYAVNGYYQDSKFQALAPLADAMFPDRTDPHKDPYNGEAADGGWGLKPEARVVAFNNHPDTTKEDVIALFQKAGIKADEVLS